LKKKHHSERMVDLLIGQDVDGKDPGGREETV